MNTRQAATRRRFLLKAGAALSVPLAVGSAQASAVGEDDAVLKAQLADQNELTSIRKLQQNLARYINVGDDKKVAALFVSPAAGIELANIRHIAPADFGEHDIVDLAADRQSASAELHCAVEAETAIDIDCTLAEMAHQQGDGVLRRREARVLQADLVRRSGHWKIQSLNFR